MKSLLDKAEKLEKNYEWLQAAEIYNEASRLALARKNIRKASELQGILGFSYYRAALQAKSNIEFKKILKKSISAYELESELLEDINTEICHIKKKHATAMTMYLESRFETDPKRIIKFLYKWWTLENQVARLYETIGDLLSAGKTFNDLIEYSSYSLLWILSSSPEIKKIFKDILNLSEKAIKIFRRLGNNYELARAYSSAVWYYSFSNWYFEDNNKIVEFAKKCQEYTERAIELAHKSGDAWLISMVYHSAWNVVYLGNIDPSSALEYGDKVLEYGIIAKDNYLIGNGYMVKSWANTNLVRLIEDPEKQKKTLKNTIELSQKAQQYYKIIQNQTGFNLTYTHNIQAISSLVSIESDPIKKQELIQKATNLLEEGEKFFQGWLIHSGLLFLERGTSYYRISETISEIEEKRNTLNQSEFYFKKALTVLKVTTPNNYQFHSIINFQLALIQIAFAQIEANTSKKLKFLDTAINILDKCICLINKRETILQTKWAYGVYFGQYYFKLGSTLKWVYNLNKDKERFIRAIDSYRRAAQYYTKSETPTYLAETYWRLAQLYDQTGDFQEASKNYEIASQAYGIASKKIPQLKAFYKEYSLYILAWSQIEQARYSHSIEEYEEARQHYKKAAKLHESTSSWNYLAPNYFAWANVEKAEALSRKEDTKQAKQTFQKAFEQFSRSEESIKQELKEITSIEEKEMGEKLFKASKLRQKYCRARILMEEAKLLDREGKYLQSSKKYGEAAQNVSAIVDKIDVEAERNELKYLEILCQAWQKMAVAEEKTSSQPYLQAATLFEEAKEHCYTKKASLWALGNSNFCKGLAAGIEYQSSMNLKENALAKRYIKSAASSYLQAGFKNASEYAKATQRLFDAYVFMNQAEGEVDPEKKAKQYQMAENLLQIAAGSFMKAKHPEKTDQVQQILKNVREEKALAVSLSQVMQAPSIASTTRSFSAPTPTSEASVGLEQFEHANVQANLVTQVKEIKVAESFSLSVEFVNAGKEPALLMRVDNFVPHDFVVVKKPEIYRLEDTTLNMKGKQLAPLKLVEVKLVLQPSRKGNYKLNPRVHYLDELGQKKALQLKMLEIKVEEVLLEDRVSTGTQELDSLLLGGIPEGYAVVLTGPPSDEREYLINNFLDAGIKEDQIIFYIATEAGGLENLLENPSFYLFLCNPKPKTRIPDLPNIYKLKSKTDLTNLSISLAKAYREIEPTKKKRICVEIVSDVLISYKAEATRRWISELITDLGAKGFTMLCVLDPTMHPSDQANAVINLLDGEISITKSGDPLECKKSILVKKLRNQDYIKNPICLT